jgi:hypothetical protein
VVIDGPGDAGTVPSVVEHRRVAGPAHAGSVIAGHPEERSVAEAGHCLFGSTEGDREIDRRPGLAGAPP